MSEPNAKPQPPNFLEVNAAANPDKPMVIGLDRTISWGQLRERSRALAQRLFELGLRPGDQAAVMTYNFPEYY
jgi:acyl-CoA synthetase (AMP-forming)/AMP-acid ligase II